MARSLTGWYNNYDMLIIWIAVAVIVVSLLIAWVVLPLWWKRRQRNPQKVTLADLQLSITRLQATIWQATITEIGIIVSLLALIMGLSALIK